MWLIVSPSGVMDGTAQIHHRIAFLFLIREYNKATLYQCGIPSKVPEYSAYNI